MATHMPFPRIHTTVLLAAALFATSFSIPAPARSQTPAPPQSGPIALVGGTIHTVSGGVIENGTLVFDNGVITDVGRDVAVPAAARRIDITGREVYPGLIEGYSQMGLYEVGAVDVTVDVNELGSLNPNARAHVAFNPESRHIGVARSNGVLVALSTPGGGLISGLSAAMMLDGWTWEQMTLKAETGLMVNWPSPFRADQYDESVRELRDFFADARAYGTARRAAPDRHGTDPRFEALLPILDRRTPVVVNANELRQIQDAVAWAEAEDVRLVLLGGRDAGYVADLLASRGIPVVLTTILDSPNRAWEPYDKMYALPHLLHRAGVEFAIAGSSSAPYANRLPYEAGAAIAYGLPPEVALRSVTLNPARFFGFDDRAGSLDVGKDATLLITTGSPLEYSTTVEQAFIQGRAIDMMDAHRQFFEKYSEKVRQSMIHRPILD